MPIVDLLPEELLKEAVTLGEQEIERRQANSPEGLRARADIPDKLGFLFERGSYRYKAARSGRYATKSWSFARVLLILGISERLRIVCGRETMKSIADSVHALLDDQIKLLGISDKYEVQKTRIYGENGTEFGFVGMRQQTVDHIKSLEGCDIFWVEEAQSLSKKSWEVLTPTIRKEGSELWFSFNPDLATDPTYQRLVSNPPPSSMIVEMNWRDNKWLTPAMKREIDHLRATDPDAYEHVYEGATRSTVENAVCKEEIRRAEREGRLCRVPYDTTRPVDTFWDLGYGDGVAIWFAQPVGFEYRVIDYYESAHQAIDFYLQVLQSKGYTYGTCVLPWDGGAKQLRTGRSIEELIRAKGFKATVLPQLSVADGINAVRTIFPQCWFDAERCQDGLSGLRRYQWGPPTESGAERRQPIHDAASHPADAFRTLAVHIKIPVQSSRPTGSPLGARNLRGGWMS